MVKRFFFFHTNLAIKHWTISMKKQVAMKKHYVVLPNCNRAFRPYFDILFILSLDILKNDVTCVQCSLALYFVVIASHQM